MTATVIKSGTALTIAVTPGENGQPETADAFRLAVLNDNQQVVWEGTADIPFAEGIDGLTFDAEASDIASDETAYLIYRIEWITGGQPNVGTFVEVIVEPAMVLQPLKNSFATYGQLSLVARGIAGLTGFACCSAGGGGLSNTGDGNPALVAAYINAFHNIGYVTVDFNPPKYRTGWHDQSRWDGDGIFSSDVSAINTTRKLTPELWLELKPWQQEALIRAQVIEANYLLSGNTPEKQRYSGLLSHSAGESAYFYRSFKPLELPVSKATANALKGIITYVTRIGG